MNDYSSYCEVKIVQGRAGRLFELNYYSLPDKKGPYQVLELGDAESARKILKMLEEKLNMAD
jgi:hypothetical protein